MGLLLSKTTTHKLDSESNWGVTGKGVCEMKSKKKKKRNPTVFLPGAESSRQCGFQTSNISITENLLEMQEIDR